jgi:hypothetical protein
MRVAALAAGGSVAADADAASQGEANRCVSTTEAAGVAAAAGVGGGHTGVLDSAAAAAELAALEAAEAALHVALRQEVLRRLVAVQMSLAKDTVSWRRGVLATPQVGLTESEHSCSPAPDKQQIPRWLSQSGAAHVDATQLWG